MTRLFSLVYSLAATVLGGVGLVIVLVSVAQPTLALMIAAFAAGAVLAVPVAYVVARKLHRG